MLPTWQRIDRERLLVEVSRAAEARSLLIVRGGDSDGLGVAANLVCENLDLDLDHDVIRSREPLQAPATLRDRLLDCWRVGAGPLEPNVLPPWLTTRAFISTSQLRQEISAIHTDRQKAIVFDTVDRHAALDRGHMREFEALSEECGCLVVAFVRRESNSRLQGIRVHDLEAMTVEHVEAKLYPVRTLIGVDVPFLDELLESLREIEIDGQIAAQDVYDVVGSRLPVEAES